MPYLSRTHHSTPVRLICTALLVLLAFAATPPTQADCVREPEKNLSRHAFYLINAAKDAAADPGDFEEVWQLLADVRCGNGDSLELLKGFQKQTDTVFPATVMLVDSKNLDAIELVGALERASLPRERKAELLRMVADWPGLQNASASAARIVKRTEWAATSGDEQLSNVARELRAMFGDESSIAARVERLMVCAEDEDGGIGIDCLGMHELHTGPFSVIQSRWDAASMPQRYWLTLWARPTEETRTFLLARLPDEQSDVQQQILIGPMKGSEYAIKAALILIQQSATDASRRPRNVPIDFSHDYREGLFGIAAYEPGEDYPSALQIAFEELTTYPYEDAAKSMHDLVNLDHPWLATQAGLWLVRHGQAKSTKHALRYTLEADGLPAYQVLTQVFPIGDAGTPPQTRELFIETIQRGSLGKWEAFTETHYLRLLEDPAVIDAIMARIASLPQRVDDAGIDITLDESLRARMEEQKAFKSELDAIEWATSASKDSPERADRYIHAFASLDAPLWRAYAMATAMEMGREDMAKQLAQNFVDSPVSTLRDKAREIVGISE